MLACAQDIFFTTNSSDSNSNNDQFNDPSKDKRSRQHRHINNNQFQPQQHLLQKDLNSNKEKEEQQVWPPDVEDAFIKALETIPKLGRRKILVNGKPCGRNELISDFIFRKTGKVRTRKQVSSHIQVLKNTRKGDPHFMRLLTDSVEDEGFVTSAQTHRKPKTATMPRRQNNTTSSNHTHHQQKITLTDLSSDESSMSSSPSPADYVFDIMYHDQQASLSMLDMKDPFYEPFFGALPNNLTNTNNNSSAATASNTIIDTNVGGMATSLSFQNLAAATTNDVLQQLFPYDENAATNSNKPTVVDLLDSNFSSMKQQYQKQKKTIANTRKYNRKKKVFPINNMHFQPSSSSSMNMMLEGGNMTLPGSSNIWIDPSIYPLWPNYICLYLEYSLPYDPSITIPHTLANLPECVPNCIPTVDASLVARNKCPSLTELSSNPAVTTLAAKVKLNLNLNMSDFFFNNTSFFETQDRRTVECTTTIYSFGNVVLESKEVQQALWINEGKYMYSFVYVNQFFDAFMKGIRSLQSWDEVDIAINNLCVVQVFEDIESRVVQPMEGMLGSNDMTTDDLNAAAAVSTCAAVPEISPLLVMVYEFERGHGTMEISIVDTLSSSIKKDFADFLANPSNVNDPTLSACSSASSSSSSTLAHVDM
ncbi:TEA/ATTS domain family-domain-containing protein [Parasitella parasitica]|nr:TEA/ATTS domain family-domain-containing protein [Parasitella parasitica]